MVPIFFVAKPRCCSGAFFFHVKPRRSRNNACLASCHGIAPCSFFLLHSKEATGLGCQNNNTQMPRCCWFSALLAIGRKVAASDVCVQNFHALPFYWSLCSVWYLYPLAKSFACARPTSCGWTSSQVCGRCCVAPPIIFSWPEKDSKVTASALVRTVKLELTKRTLTDANAVLYRRITISTGLHSTSWNRLHLGKCLSSHNHTFATSRHPCPVNRCNDRLESAWIFRHARVLLAAVKRLVVWQFCSDWAAHFTEISTNFLPIFVAWLVAKLRYRDATAAHCRVS